MYLFEITFDLLTYISRRGHFKISVHTFNQPSIVQETQSKKRYLEAQTTSNISFKSELNLKINVKVHHHFRIVVNPRISLRKFISPNK